MTTTAQIYLDPTKAYNQLINTQEKNDIFTKLYSEELDSLGTYTTELSEKATRTALLEMKKNNQL
jgi:hypothetical protein